MRWPELNRVSKKKSINQVHTNEGECFNLTLLIVAGISASSTQLIGVFFDLAQIFGKFVKIKTVDLAILVESIKL